MAFLTDEHQAFLRAIGITGMATHRASFARIVCIYLDCHRTMHESFISNHALQLSKGPFGVGRIGISLLLGRFLATFAFGSISNVCQVFQADQAIWVPRDNALGDHMIGVSFQPSLSSTDHHQTAGSSASAFSLQTFPQSRVMVGLGDNMLSCIERAISSRGSR